MAVTWRKLAYEDDVITKALLSGTGDMIYSSGASTPARLAAGTQGYVLTMGAAVPAWASPGAPGAHKTSHENEGADEISVAGLSGLLADDQHVLDTEVTTVIEATPLNDLAAADGAVDFNGQQATDLVLHTNATPPTTAVIGKVYFDTDLSVYVCTISS